MTSLSGRHRETAVDDAILKYWKEADRIIDCYWQGFELLRSQAKQGLTKADPAPRLGQLDAHLRTARVRSSAIRDLRSEGETSRDDQVVDPQAPGFLDAVKILQGEITERLPEESPRSRVKHQDLRQVLAMSFEELRTAFGSPSNAWDQLVELKHNTSPPDEKAGATNSWLVALVSEGERFLRDMLGLTIDSVGQLLFVDAIEDCFSSEELDVSPPGVAGLLRAESPSEALAEALLDHMQQGSAETTHVAEWFARRCGFELYPTGSGFEPGLVTQLSWLGPKSSVDLWQTLLAMRRRVIHSSELLMPERETDELLRLLREQRESELEALADFVGAFGLRFAFHLLRVVLVRYGTDVGPNERLWRDGLLYKMPAELRWQSMRTLQERRWALAWAVCEMARDVEPPERDGTMLKLNACYARRQMGIAVGHRDQFVTDAEIQKLRVTEARHQLIKQVLLGRRKGVSELLARVYDESDMTLYELELWPALSDLREWPEYIKWREQFDELRE